MKRLLCAGSALCWLFIGFLVVPHFTVVDFLIVTEGIITRFQNLDSRLSRVISYQDFKAVFIRGS